MRPGMIALGAGMIAVGILPTPDDVTIVSPVAQILGGGLLVTLGVILPEKKDD